MKRPKWFPRWLHLSFIVFIAFIVWMLAFGENNFMKTHALKKQSNELKAEIKQKRDSVAFYDRKFQELSTNGETLEKIAREQYGMRNENEEIFITDIP